MNILFTHSYFLHFDPKQLATAQPYPPLGTLYAAALMMKNGHTVSVFDTMFSSDPNEIRQVITNQKPACLVIYDDGFNYLTKMCLTNMREAAFTMSRLAKEAGCTVIVSSSDSTDQYENYLHAGADYILLGEAEITLKELLESLANQTREFENIAGLAFTRNDQVIHTGRRDVIRDLDSLPFPAWDLIDIEPYRKMWVDHHGYFSINMGTTRGCPFKCNWCAKPIYGNRYNSRSPKNVVEELKVLKEKFNYDHVWFCDDIFGLKPGWVNEFANLVQEEKLSFRFKIQSRADLLVQENYIDALARAGCDNAWMGAESGSQKILDAMEKGTTIAQIYEATRVLKKHGIKPSFFIQFGYPGETMEDIEMTIRLINKLLPHDIGISVSYPLPGTKFFEMVKDQLKEKSNWTDSDELKLMFRNTYPPEFYKQLHRYVHKNYRKHIAMGTIKKIFANLTSVKASDLKKAASLAYYVPATFIAKKKLNSIIT